VWSTKRWFQLLFYLLLLIVLVLSLLPIDQPDFSPNDKVNHLLAYTVLLVSGYLAHRHLGFAGIFVVFFGVLVEILQGLTAYRMFSFADMVADSAGVALGCAGILVGKLWLKITGRER
jgi:VanZ family protein